MKTQTSLPLKRLQTSARSKINPIKNLTPQSLTRILDAFHAGHLGPAAIAFDAIERRDDVLNGVASKRKKATARLNWEILTLDDSEEALAHKHALEFFYNNLTATHACDLNIEGGFSLLVKQMLDSIGKKYAVHEIVYEPKGKHDLTATFRFVPLQFFENTTGKLAFLNSDTSQQGIELEPGNWLTTTADGLMEASSIAYLFKHLPLKDWLIYCERNGMPGIKATTEALPGTPQWNAACEAVRDFSADFSAVMSKNTNIEAIDLAAKGALPYPQLVERMDRAIIALWRGSDLSTLASQATGASLQGNETQLLLEDDAALVSETLNAQVDRTVLKHLFGVERGKAYIRIIPKNDTQAQRDLEHYTALAALGLEIPKNHMYEKFGIPHPTNNEPTLNAKDKKQHDHDK